MPPDFVAGADFDPGVIKKAKSNKDKTKKNYVDNFIVECFGKQKPQAKAKEDGQAAQEWDWLIVDFAVVGEVEDPKFIRQKLS